MSYHIYHTEGFIIDSIDAGEANKLLTLYTEDLGLVRAAAQAVRTLGSKLRPSIQDLSFASLALVRGKEVWRLTGAKKLISLYDKRLSLGGRVVLARILSLVKRLVAGESRNNELFAILSTLSSFCFKERGLFKEDRGASKDMESLEMIASLRVLASLGYKTDQKLLEKYVKAGESSVWNVGLVDEMMGDMAAARPEVARLIRESHL